MRKWLRVNSYYTIFFIIFTMGWCTYSLKLVSILKLLESLSLKAYPFLMLAQGLSLYFSMKIFRWISGSRSELFNFLSISFGGLIVLAGLQLHHFTFENELYDIGIHCLIFLFSSANLLSIDISGKMLMSEKVSILKNPKVVAQLVLVFEIGAIFAGTLSYFNSTYFHLNQTVISILPFVIAIPLFGFFNFSDKVTHDHLTHKPKSQEKVSTAQIWKFKFMTFLVGLIAVVMVTKSMQNYAFFIGMAELKNKTTNSLTTLFSQIFIVQSAMTLALLYFNFFKQKGHSSWAKGYKNYFSLQLLNFLTMTIFPIPWVNIGAGISRRIGKRGFLEGANAILVKALPIKYRFIIKESYTSFSQLISYSLLGVFSYLHIYGHISPRIIWISLFGLTTLGFYFGKNLVKKLNGLHAENIINFHESPEANFQAVSSAYALANNESQAYHRILTDVLNRRPKSIFKRAIIFSLGEMGNEKSIPVLIDQFNKADREDSQKIVLEALLKFTSYDVDLFFQRALTNIISGSENKGAMRMSLCRVIAKRNSHATIMNILNIYEQFKNDPYVLANIIEVMGVIANDQNDEWLYKKISEYLSDKYSKRVRVNSLLALFHHHKYEEKVSKVLNEYEKSGNPNDRTVVAYLAGALKLKEYHQYLLNLNRVLKGKSSTVLIGLLRLGDKDGPKNFLDFVFNENEADALLAVNQLHGIESELIRYKVYDSLFNHYEDKIDLFLKYLKLSNRDFNNDLNIISGEAKRRGKQVNIDLYGFISKEVHSRRAA